MGAYEQLRRVAELVADPETVSLAAAIGDEERAMAALIAERWDAAVDARLEAQGV